MTLRLIIKSTLSPGMGHVDICYRTFDIEAPEVEAFLRAGGISEESFLLREFVGCEYFSPADTRPLLDSQSAVKDSSQLPQGG